MKQEKVTVEKLKPLQHHLSKAFKDARAHLGLTQKQLAVIIRDGKPYHGSVSGLTGIICAIERGASISSDVLNFVIRHTNALLEKAEHITLVDGSLIEPGSALDKIQPMSHTHPKDEAEKADVRDVAYGFRVSDVHGEAKVEPVDRRETAKIEEPIVAMLTNLVKCNAALTEQNQQLAKEVKELRSDIQRLTEVVSGRNNTQPTQPHFSFGIARHPHQYQNDDNVVEWGNECRTHSQYGYRVICSINELYALADRFANLIIHVHQNDLSWLRYLLTRIPSYAAERCNVVVRS